MDGGVNEEHVLNDKLHSKSIPCNENKRKNANIMSIKSQIPQFSALHDSILQLRCFVRASVIDKLLNRPAGHSSETHFFLMRK